MRIQYKGGVWKNSEDEILKVAVMKYGKNQWARIASLLVRKSAKQCKARWFEWLDPAIKKTQWTREEEEKLLHLVKIMPTAWRTIAPMIGRTAAQCIEHYEKLIDQAQQNSVTGNADGAGPSNAADPHSAVAAASQRPGDVDAAPESKPARPDPVDMDEDELEMLSEARARLANTKGKKAKRKAREKQLEAAKRLAQLQKRRELKAAGVPIKPSRKSRKVTDYATEIPFERAPAPGFYDTREEDDRAVKIMSEKNQIGKLLQKYQGPTEAEKEEAARKRDAVKRKQLEKTNLPAALGLATAATAPRSPPLKRARFSLPAPQLSDLELEKIAKSGETQSSFRRASQPAAANGVPAHGSSAQLSAKPFQNSVASAPHSSTAVPWAATRQRHLETIMTMKSAQTPLRGGENTPIPSLGLDGRATPARSDVRTPNPLATPSHISGTSQVASNTAQAAKSRKKQLAVLRETVRKGLAALPEPENEYELDFGEVQVVENGDASTDVDNELEEDAEEEAARRKRESEEQLIAVKNRLLSSAAKQSLPVPRNDDITEGEVDEVVLLARRDRYVLRVLQDAEMNSTAPEDVVVELNSVLGKDEVAEKDLRRANELVERHVRAAEDSQGVQASIFEQLCSSDRMGDDEEGPALQAEAHPVPDPSSRHEFQFRREREERLKELSDVYNKHPLNGRQEPNVEHLMRRVGMVGDKRVYAEAEAATDEKAIVALVDDLRGKIASIGVPNSLSDSYRDGNAKGTV